MCIMVLFLRILHPSNHMNRDQMSCFNSDRNNDRQTEVIEPTNGVQIHKVFNDINVILLLAHIFIHKYT